jgi:hypothetical protein
LEERLRRRLKKDVKDYKDLRDLVDFVDFVDGVDDVALNPKMTGTRSSMKSLMSRAG